MYVYKFCSIPLQIETGLQRRPISISSIFWLTNASYVIIIESCLKMNYNFHVFVNVVLYYFREAPCVVVNVEYRLAPEHKYPANHDDAKCVVRWVAMNKSLVGEYL